MRVLRLAAIGSRQLLVEVYQWLGLVVIDRQAMTHGFFGVVFTLYQRLAGFVVLAFNLRRIVDHVVNAARTFVNAATGNTLNDFFVGDGDFNHSIQLDTSSHQGFSLRNGAWETVEQETVGTVRLGDAVLDQVDDQLVGNQLASVHDRLGFQAQRGAGLDSGAQHVASGDLRNGEFFGDELCLSTFTGPGSSQQNYAHLVLLIFL
ncbi:hypothetical protein D9M73_189080 [compost metagenome]